MARHQPIDLPVLPGRLHRLAEELADEGITVLNEVDDRVSALVELADALRPQRFEGRVPTYGALLPPAGKPLPHVITDDTHLDFVDVHELDL